MTYKQMFACYQFSGKLDDPVGRLPFEFDTLNVAAATQEKLIEYLVENYGKEIGREYYNKDECVKVETEREMLGKIIRRVYVIMPIFILDEVVEVVL